MDEETLNGVNDVQDLFEGCDFEGLRYALQAPEFISVLELESEPDLLAPSHVTCSENQHSDILAGFFDSRRNAHAGELLKTFIKHIAGECKSVQLDAFCRTQDGDWHVVAVRERYFKEPDGQGDEQKRNFIDILLHIRADSPSQGTQLFTIAIENKVWAAEQPEQIKRYQACLAREYAYTAAIVIFLTPTGRSATTADDYISAVPCIPVGYDVIVDVLRSHTKMVASGTYRKTAKVYANHIRRYIVEDAKRLAAINTLWKDQKIARALEAAYRDRPRLQLIEDLCDSETKLSKQLLSRFKNEGVNLIEFEGWNIDYRTNERPETLVLYHWLQQGATEAILIWYVGAPYPPVQIRVSSYFGRPVVAPSISKQHIDNASMREKIYTWMSKVNEELVKRDESDRWKLDLSWPEIEGSACSILADLKYPDAYFTDALIFEMDAIQEIVEKMWQWHLLFKKFVTYGSAFPE